MRLWHQALIPLLPRQQLLGQHSECSALRGNGWGKKHASVDYVFEHDWYDLYIYHTLIMFEMVLRGYKVDTAWLKPEYRGKKCEPRESVEPKEYSGAIYPEHNMKYLKECLENLKEKGIDLYDKFIGLC